MSTISVIVPVYNGATYLDKCLNSLLNQSINDLEVILVNDGSCIYTWRINGYCRCNIHRDHCN